MPSFFRLSPQALMRSLSLIDHWTAGDRYTATRQGNCNWGLIACTWTISSSDTVTLADSVCSRDIMAERSKLVVWQQPANSTDANSPKLIERRMIENPP